MESTAVVRLSIAVFTSSFSLLFFISLTLHCQLCSIIFHSLPCNPSTFQLRHFYTQFSTSKQAQTLHLSDMSSSTALLPRTKKDDHPIFLRVSHSPWLIVNQEVLMLARGIIALYMAMVFLLVVYYEMKKTDRGCLIAFEFPNISYLLQVIYHCITFVRPAILIIMPGTFLLSLFCDNVFFSLNLIPRLGPSCICTIHIMVAPLHPPQLAYRNSFHHLARTLQRRIAHTSVYFTLLQCLIRM